MIRYLPLAFALLILPAWAGLYKWTDENGKVHYSDQPPPSDAKQSQTLKESKSAASAPDPTGAKPAAAAAKTPAEQEMEFRKRRLEAAEAEAKAKKEAEATEEKKRNCERANAQVASLQRGGRLTRPGPNGEQIYMSDEEIAKELGNARKAADSWCK